MLGQDAVCWVRVGLSCSPDHFLPYLGNLDFLLPFVPYFSLVKLSLVLLEAAARAGPGERAVSPLSPLTPPRQSWHRRNGTRLCQALAGGEVLRGELLQPRLLLAFLRKRGDGSGRVVQHRSAVCPAWLVLGSDLPCPQDTERAVSP